MKTEKYFVLLRWTYAVKFVLFSSCESSKWAAGKGLGQIFSFLGRHHTDDKGTECFWVTFSEFQREAQKEESQVPREQWWQLIMDAWCFLLELKCCDCLDYKLSQNKSSRKSLSLLYPPCFHPPAITLVSCSVIVLPCSIWKVFPLLLSWPSVSHTRR